MIEQSGKGRSNMKTMSRLFNPVDTGRAPRPRQPIAVGVEPSLSETELDQVSAAGGSSGGGFGGSGGGSGGN
jgi:hypothetical protein